MRYWLTIEDMEAYRCLAGVSTHADTVGSEDNIAYTITEMGRTDGRGRLLSKDGRRGRARV